MNIDKGHKKRVFVVGHYGMSNVGDDAMLRVITHFLKERSYDVSVLCIGNNVDIYNILDVKIVPFWDYNILRLIKEIYNSNYVIFGGGDLIKNVSFTKLLPIIYLCIILRKRFAFFGIGIRKLYPILHYQFMYIAKKAFFISVRDEESIINSYPINPSLMPDIAFGLPHFLIMPMRKSGMRKSGMRKSGMRISGNDGNKIIGVNMRPPLIADMFDSKKLWDEMLENIKHENIDEILFFPFQSCDNDEARKFLDLNLGIKTRIINGSLEEILYEMSKVDSVIGMRLHFLTFAHMLDIPFVAIPYNKKVVEFEKRYKNDKYSAKMARDVELSFYELFRKMENIGT